jgi:hypothetical protein
MLYLFYWLEAVGVLKRLSELGVVVKGRSEARFFGVLRRLVNGRTGVQDLLSCRGGKTLVLIAAFESAAVEAVDEPTTFSLFSPLAET